jgi:ribose transport system substrate-binding protein
MLRRTILSAVALSALALSGGCREDKKRISVIPPVTATLLWEPFHLGVAETARDSGLSVYWNGPSYEGDIEKQLSFLSSSIARPDSGIIFAPNETFASRSLILDAINRRVPVVIVDDELGPPPGDLLSYVSDDEKAGATLASERLAKLLQGKGTIAVIGISPRLEHGLSRVEDFERDLKRVAPGVRIAVRRFGDAVVTHQQQIAQEILKGPEHIDAIVAMTAIATRGAYFAKLASQPASSVLIIGFDQDMLLPIQSGEVDSVVVQNTREIGRAAMHNLEAQIRGDKVPGTTLVSPLLLTRETIESPAIKHLWEFTSYRWETQ